MTKADPECEEFFCLIEEFFCPDHVTLKGAGVDNEFDVDTSSPQYKKTRRKFAGYVSMGTGIAMATGDEQAMDMAFFFSRKMNESFDEWYSIRYPKK